MGQAAFVEKILSQLKLKLSSRLFKSVSIAKNKNVLLFLILYEGNFPFLSLYNKKMEDIVCNYH